jgi:cytochrome c oxidase assembly protein subunit 15
LPFLALLAVCVQGLLGGLRVLENSPQLAFVHGALAQAVFAFLFATALYLSPRWRATEPSVCKTAPGLARSTSFGVAAVFAQISLGAWLRHSGSDLALALHVLVAAVVFGAVISTAKQLRAAVAQTARGGSDRSLLLRVRRNLHVLLGTQIALGALATFWIYEVSGGMQARVSMGEAIFATAHVAIGALLLAQVVSAAMWARRVVCSPATASLQGAGALR